MFFSPSILKAESINENFSLNYYYEYQYYDKEYYIDSLDFTGQSDITINTIVKAYSESTNQGSLVALSLDQSAEIYFTVSTQLISNVSNITRSTNFSTSNLCFPISNGVNALTYATATNGIMWTQLYDLGYRCITWTQSDNSSTSYLYYFCKFNPRQSSIGDSTTSLYGDITSSSTIDKQTVQYCKISCPKNFSYNLGTVSIPLTSINMDNNSTLVYDCKGCYATIDSNRNLYIIIQDFNDWYCNLALYNPSSLLKLSDTINLSITNLMNNTIDDYTDITALTYTQYSGILNAIQSIDLDLSITNADLNIIDTLPLTWTNLSNLYANDILQNSYAQTINNPTNISFKQPYNLNSDNIYFLIIPIGNGSRYTTPSSYLNNLTYSFYTTALDGPYNFNYVYSCPLNATETLIVFKGIGTTYTNINLYFNFTTQSQRLYSYTTSPSYRFKISYLDNSYSAYYNVNNWLINLSTNQKINQINNTLTNIFNEIENLSDISLEQNITNEYDIDIDTEIGDLLSDLSIQIGNLNLNDSSYQIPEATQTKLQSFKSLVSLPFDTLKNNGLGVLVIGPFILMILGLIL